MLYGCLAYHLPAGSSAERLKMADSWRPRHYRFFTHIKHWPIYCADWQAGKQSVSTLSLKQAATISETHTAQSLIHQVYKWLLPILNLLVRGWTTPATGKKDCKTDFHRFTFNWVKMQKRRSAAVTMIHDVLIWQKLHPQRHPFWLALEKCDILTAIYKCASLLKRNKIKH